MKRAISTFILTLVLWIIFAGRFNIEIFLLGIIISLIISLVLKKNVPNKVKSNYWSKDVLLKLFYTFRIVIAFLCDLFLSALRISRYTFQIKPSFSHRLVRINTTLEHVNSIAILLNLITLPKGALVIDFDHSKRDYFIHWLDIHSDDEAKIKESLIIKHENTIAKIVD